MCTHLSRRAGDGARPVGLVLGHVQSGEASGNLTAAPPPQLKFQAPPPSSRQRPLVTPRLRMRPTGASLRSS